ncbi:MAG: PAS domain-containing protein, partial [Pseudomonadota bacterium]
MAGKNSGSKPSARQVAAIGALFSAPFAILLAVLVASGRLAAGPALVGGLLAAAAVLIVVWRSLAAFLAVRDELDRMPDGESREFMFRVGPAAMIDAAVRRLGGRLAERHKGMEAGLALAESVNAALPAPMLLLDGNRRILVANAAAREFFARDPGGLDLSAVLRDPKVLEAVQDVLGGASERDVDFTQPVPVERSLNAMIRPLTATPQAGAAALVLIQDLTAIKRTE